MMTNAGEHQRFSPPTFLGLAIGAFAVSLLLILPLMWLLRGELPLWLHIPVTALNLGLLALTGMAAGVAFVHWRWKG